jgi:hypothetical protein
MPSEGSTKYVPTEEEIKKGEDTMTDAQKTLDVNTKEKSVKFLKAMGVEGFLGGVEGTKDVNGIINGHKIYLFLPDGGSKWIGKIDDNIDMNESETNAFFNKYGGAVVRSPVTEFNLAKDLEGKTKESVLKDIGL